MAVTISDDPSVVYQLVKGTANPKRYNVAPRAACQIDGQTYPLLRFTTQHNCASSADTATVTMPISNGPDFSAAIARGDLPGGTDNSPVYVEIRAGFPQNPNLQPASLFPQLQRRFLGIVDVYNAKLEADRITFNCRSMAAPLLDYKISSLNWHGTSVDFLAYYAKNIGMTFVPKLAYPPASISKVLAANGFGGSNLQAQVYAMHPWDLAMKCAIVDDAVLFVDENGTLNYASPWLISRTNFQLNWLSDWLELELTHSPQYSKNIVVKGRSFTPRIKQSTTCQCASDGAGGVNVQAVTRTVTSAIIPGTNETVTTNYAADGTVKVTNSTSTGGPYSGSQTEVAPNSGKQVYIVPIPHGTTPADVNRILLNAWRMYSMHEYAIDGSFEVTPDTIGIGITSMLKVEQTPYSYFNTSTSATVGGKKGYWPLRIEETFDQTSEGWRMNVHAVNHTPPVGAV
jgi:hypothetical protein